jgi:hypothetical protein
MLLEMRTYTLRPGAQAEYWQHYREGGAECLDPVRRNLVGYFVTEIGPLNRVVHLWNWQDLAQRQAGRAAVGANPAWQAHLGRIRPLMQAQETALLLPAPVPGLVALAPPG